MNYTYQVAYLNAVKAKKLIPADVFEEIEDEKSLSSLISVLKEYQYRHISHFTQPDLELLAAENFEKVIYIELFDTTNFISQLLLEPHKWLTEWFKYFFDIQKMNNIDDIIQFHHKFTLHFATLKSKFCNQLLRFIIDFENIKLFLTYNVINEKDKLIFITGGNIPTSKLKDCYPNLDDLNKYLNHTFYPTLKISQQESPDSYFYEYLLQLLWYSKFFYFTIEPIVCYFFEKLTETYKLKKVYYNLKNISRG